MYKPNAAVQFYCGLFGKHFSEFYPELTLWQNIAVWKHEAATQK